MRKLYKLMVLSFVFILSVGLNAEAALKRYKVKSGHIKYDNTSGSEELIWDDFGAREARFTNVKTKIFGISREENTANYIDGQWSYSYDEKTKKAMRMDYEEMMKRLAGNNSTQPMEFSDKMIKDFGGEKVGKEKILGRNCDIYILKNFSDYKVWIYKGLALKAEASFMGFEFKMVATEFKENVAVDQTRLRLPADAKIEDVDMATMPNADEIKQAREAMNAMQKNGEIKNAMEVLQEMQNDPKIQEAMQRAEKERERERKASKSLAERTEDIVVEETSNAVEDTVRDATRNTLKKGFSNALKSLF